ncbi:MAG: substrate-binding domain-containing protein [Bacteroidota bacterium]
METKTIRLGGVPEHFNLPIHLAIENGSFASRGVQIDWTTFKGGTGQMTKALRAGEVDACILLTEGIIKDIIAGNPSKIVSGYVNTPLIWGIHTGQQNTLTHHNDIYSRQYAISRFGSGSHLMAIVDANTQDQKIDKEQFSIIKNLDGALDSLAAGETDVFYWEKYTTKPFVDNGQLRRVGQFITPWPCFMIAATNDILAREPDSIIRMLRTIHDSCDSFMQSDDNIPLVAARYGLKMKDATGWYHATEWAIHGWVSDKMLRSVIHNLRVAEIIGEDDPIPDLVWKR